VHVILGGALHEAERLMLIKRNPVKFVRAPRPINREMIALDETGASRLLSLAKGTRLNVPIVLALTCGLRRGEILGLRWQDVDLDKSRLVVRKVLARYGATLVMKEPKTRSSIRSIALPQLAKAELRAHRVAQIAARLAAGLPTSPDDLVCPTHDGSPWHPASFSDAWNGLVRRHSQVPRLRFHDLRHTHATLLLRANVPAKVVSERLGHSSVGVTLDVYSHVLPDMQEDAASRLDQALAATKPDQVSNNPIPSAAS
jgi:integrase